VMHGTQYEFRLEEVPVSRGSSLAGATLREAAIRERTGAMVLALRSEDGAFLTNPSAETVVGPGQVLIAIGTSEELADLVALA